MHWSASHFSLIGRLIDATIGLSATKMSSISGFVADLELFPVRGGNHSRNPVNIGLKIQAQSDEVSDKIRQSGKIQRSSEKSDAVR